MSLFSRSSKYDDSSPDFAVIQKSDSRNSDGTAQFELPTYDVTPPWEHSSRDPLTTVGVLIEIRANYKRSRLMLYETARRKHSWSSLMSKKRGKIKLDGPASELDRALNDMVYSRVSGDVGTTCSAWHRGVRTGLSSKVKEEGYEVGKMQAELVLNDSEIKEFISTLLVSRMPLDF